MNYVKLLFPIFWLFLQRNASKQNFQDLLLYFLHKTRTAKQDKENTFNNQVNNKLS